MSTKITVAYGDGIGSEIMTSVLSLLQEASAKISIDVVEIGYKAYKKGWKVGISDSAWNTIIRNKILLKAPISTPRGEGFNSLNVTLRKALGLYANIRPCMTYFNNKVDIVIIRENEEDIYSGIEYRHTANTFNGMKIISYDSSLRICKYAFEYAKINNRKKVTCFTKDNIMKMTDGTFHKAFKKISEDYPDIKSESYILDIGVARLATRPEDFDVIVTTNLYGDIISDIAAEITGSIGLASSVNVGNEYAMFEAVHGSAPDLANQNIANPSGLLNSAISMLSFIGQNKVAKNIYNAWYKAIISGVHTADLYTKDSLKKVSTEQFTEEVISNLGTNEGKYNISKYPSIDISNIINNIKTPCRKLVGVDLFIEWDSRKTDELVTRLLSVKSEDMKIRNLLAKGLIIWPRNEVIKALPSDTVCCRFITENEATSHDKINLLLSELLDLEISSLHKLYLFDGEESFRPC